MSQPSRQTDFGPRDPGLPRFVYPLAIGSLLLSLWILIDPAATAGFSGGILRQPEDLEQEQEAALRRAGAALFVREGCGDCHALVPGEDSVLGPSLAGAVPRAERRLTDPSYLGQANDASAYIAESIVEHCLDTSGRYDCPSLPDLGLRLGLTDIDALVALIASLEAEPGSEPQP